MPRPRPTLAERIDFAALMQPVALRLLGEPNSRLSKPPADIRYGTHGSVSINSQSGQFFDHEANIGGGVLDLVKHKTGADHAGAVLWLREQGFLNGARHREATPSAPAKPILATMAAPKIIATYDYTDENGALLFQAVRFEPKEFRQRRPDGPRRLGLESRWRETGAVPTPEVIAAAATGRTICITEGEKDADTPAPPGLHRDHEPHGLRKMVRRI